MADAIRAVGRDVLMERIASLPPEDIQALRYDWSLWARPEQVPPPGDWDVWLAMAGRRWGKTRCAAEYVRRQVNEYGVTSVGLVGRNPVQLREDMVEGPSGILSVFPPGCMRYIKNNRHIVGLGRYDGVRMRLISAEDEDAFRGAGFQLLWMDEAAAYRKDQQGIWNQARITTTMPVHGDKPRIIVTTTPRPTQWMRDLVQSKGVIVSKGRTRENVGNLDAGAVSRLMEQFHGSAAEKQELEGELLDYMEGALWRLNDISATRVESAPECERIVVGVDPSGVKGSTGIVVVGAAGDHRYVLEDATIRHPTPQEWAARVIKVAAKWKADTVIAEKNYGGDMVESTLAELDPDIYVDVVSATRGKVQRAQPYSVLYAKGRAHHVGVHQELELEMVSWVPGDTTWSPNRVDALVWALHGLAERRLYMSTGD